MQHNEPINEVLITEICTYLRAIDLNVYQEHSHLGEIPVGLKLLSTQDLILSGGLFRRSTLSLSERVKDLDSYHLYYGEDNEISGIHIQVSPRNVLHFISQLEENSMFNQIFEHVKLREEVITGFGFDLHHLKNSIAHALLESSSLKTLHANGGARSSSKRESSPSFFNIPEIPLVRSARTSNTSTLRTSISAPLPSSPKSPSTPNTPPALSPTTRSSSDLPSPSRLSGVSPFASRSNSPKGPVLTKTDSGTSIRRLLDKL